MQEGVHVRSWYQILKNSREEGGKVNDGKILCM